MIVAFSLFRCWPTNNAAALDGCDLRSFGGRRRCFTRGCLLLVPDSCLQPVEVDIGPPACIESENRDRAPPRWRNRAAGDSPSRPPYPQHTDTHRAAPPSWSSGSARKRKGCRPGRSIPGRQASLCSTAGQNRPAYAVLLTNAMSSMRPTIAITSDRRENRHQQQQSAIPAGQVEIMVIGWIRLSDSTPPRRGMKTN